VVGPLDVLEVWRAVTLDTAVSAPTATPLSRSTATAPRVPTAFGVPYLGTTRLTDADAEESVPDIDLGAPA